MGTTALSVIIEKMSKNIGDFIEVAVTTAINADNAVVSTNLNQYDNTADNYFIDWHCYIVDKENAGVHRQISDYTTSGGTLAIRGGALTDDSTDLATIRLTRYSADDYVSAIQDAILEKYPETFLYLEDRTLITNNILPDSSFEWWTSAALSKFYTGSNTTLAQTATVGKYRGARGTTSALSTVSANNGYLFINSDSYPRLLDLMNTSVTARCWAYPETADDPTIVIFTIQADGTTQTLTSETACPAGYFTLIEHKNQAINNDIVHFDIRFKTATSGDYTYWDSARLLGQDVHEYMLPENFQDGDVSEVWVQARSRATYPCDDILPKSWTQVFNSRVIDDGTYKFLYLPDSYEGERQIRLIGRKPLESLSTATNTITLDQEHIRPLIAYALYLLFERQKDGTASEDIERIEYAAQYWLGKYNMLSSLNPKQTIYMKLPRI